MGVTEQAARLLREFCVHLPHWRKLDPLGRLQRARTDEELLAVFAALGDRHTHCALPTKRVAWLPFLAAACREGVFVTGSVSDAVRRGDQVVQWNGVPIAAALRALMPLQLGANRPARAAKAMQTLTFRPLSIMPAPGERAVTLTMDGGRRVTLEWRIDEPETLAREIAPLFASDETAFGDTIRVAGRIIRIPSFVQAPEPFLQDFLRALESVPGDGVVLDLRGCEEGIIQTAEQLLQLFTDRPIEPERFRFRVTESIRVIAHRLPAEWQETIARTRGVYSPPCPITRGGEANRVGRRYRGPLVVLVDALTYSSAEMFAAGVQDHGIGVVLGTAARTGGGGASAWSQQTIAEMTGEDDLRPRPGAPSMRVAVRKAQRVLRNEGKAIERIGIIPDVRHAVSRADLFENESALQTAIHRILAEKPNHR